MAPRSYSRGEPCEECGSTRYITSDDGYTYCQRGHQQSARGTAVAHGEEAGELVITGRKSKRKDTDADSVASTKSGLSAPRAFEQYLLCLQLILRKQLQFLLDTQHLPGELEVLVRDMWALRLRKHQSKVTYDRGIETEAQSQQFSSQSGGETSASDATRRSRSISQRRRKEKADAPATSILDCVALIYLACVLLRQPVTIADLYTWVQAGDMLYYGANKEVPMGMRERLPAVYQDMLEPQLLSKPDKLHKHVLKMSSSFHENFGMVMVPLNRAPVLYRWLLELALPIECHTACLRLCNLLDLRPETTPDVPLSKRNAALAYAEVRLMAVLVITTKLLFPFDQLKRYSSSATDLSALDIDWSRWLSLQADMEEECHALVRHHKAIEFGAAAAQGSVEQMNEYLDWAERNIASQDVRGHGKAGKYAECRRTMFRIFAVDNQKAGASSVPRGPDQDEHTPSSPPADLSLARSAVDNAPTSCQPQWASKDAANPASDRFQAQTAREDVGEAEQRADAYLNDQPSADRLIPAPRSSNCVKPSTSTITPRVTGSLFAKRIAEDKGTQRSEVAASKNACHAHGVLDREFDLAGSFYRRFGGVEDLRSSGSETTPSIAKMLHKRAADVVGISLETLVKSVFSVEQMMLRREDAARRENAA